ncbi:MAG TPA: N-acetyl-gamma-glutamyl-phosphate reductase [Phycisphaerae bacterium]|nr:N-acetyl-gamma-glutamyl-phosphate reductase [Phycisphaerae bacterium]
MKSKIYVDGQEGTTGLRINEYLAARNDIEILKIDPDKRKDPAERKRLLNAADVAFLCLPDAASREAVAMIDNPYTRVIDASTAFRTDSAWAYGLPELSPAHRKKIKTSKRIANPGCHATAFLLSVYPLVSAGIIPAEAILTCFSLTGYSGGGKKMIAQYEAPDAPGKLKAPRHYALGMNHKHLPEMQKIAGLTHPPLFTPVVCNVHSGLAVEVFLPVSLLRGAQSPQKVHAQLAAHYEREPFVEVLPFDPARALDDGFFDMTACNDTNRADLAVFGNHTGEGQIVLLCRLDNLGKGAAGAAVQCLNMLLGAPETAGLSIR